MELFFAEPENIHNNEIVLSEFERKHILQTLRKAAGDEVIVTNGLGKLYRTKLITEKPKLRLEILSIEKKEKPPVSLSLAIGYIRPSRLEFVFEKGTELGVSNFFVIRTEHANYYSENFNRYQKIIRQALKQSQQFHLPKIQAFPSLDEFLKQTHSFDFKIAAISSDYPLLINKINSPDQDIYKSFLYIAGPEGGFNAKEIDRLQASDFSMVSLGSTRLRAETAAIAGISTIQQYIHQ